VHTSWRRCVPSWSRSRDWEATGSGPRVQLFHGSRTAWNLYDDHYLTRLASKPWFAYTPVVSEDPTYPGTRGLVGYRGCQRRRLV
jgi:NAD(P)H-flavin reductase